MDLYPKKKYMYMYERSLDHLSKSLDKDSLMSLDPLSHLLKHFFESCLPHSLFFFEPVTFGKASRLPSTNFAQIKMHGCVCLPGSSDTSFTGYVHIGGGSMGIWAQLQSNIIIVIIKYIVFSEPERRSLCVKVYELTPF